MKHMFERIYIDNYKCLVNFELELQETVLLLGDSGVGKTAILDVVFGLRKLLAGEAKITDSVAFPASTLTRWQTRRQQLFELHVQIGSDYFTYRLKIEHDEDRRRSRIVEESLFGDETILFSFDYGDVQLFRDDGSEGPMYKADWTESALARVVVSQPSNSRLTAFMHAVRNTTICTIRPSQIHPEATGEDLLLDRYSANFVDWYRHMIQESQMSFGSYVEALRALINGFHNVRLPQSGLDSRALMFEFNGKNIHSERYELRLDELSDGQKALVVLYALLYFRRDDDVVTILIDEPDNFVALPEIQPWLMALVDMCTETRSQVIICSHHPELIDYLGPDCGIVLGRELASPTTLRHLGSDALDNGLKLSETIARGWHK